jgi:hypothetical protein
MRAQHAWEDTFARDGCGRLVPPSYQRILMLDARYAPDTIAREKLERVLAALERRHPRGPQGLLMLLGWGPGYFVRYTDWPSPVSAPLALSRHEEPVLDDFDACLHIAADSEERLEEITVELFGSRGALNGIFWLRQVRHGFVGVGLPTSRASHRIPNESPLLLGFHSGLRRNQASEVEITIPTGPLAGGTTMHVSRLALDLDQWYRRAPERRAALMYAPTVSASQAAALSEDAPSDFERLPTTATKYGVVGHAQAAARARLLGRPRLNRRDFATVDDGVPGTHFVSLQRSIEDFNATRAVMNAADAHHHHKSVGLRGNNGINEFIKVLHRATFAVPPRPLRSFPGIT